MSVFCIFRLKNIRQKVGRALVLLSCAVAAPFHANANDWANHFSSTSPNGNVQVYSVAQDGAGNTYAAGTLSDSGSANFGGISLNRIGLIDSFLVKLDAHGSVVWAKSFGGTGANIIARALVADSIGNVYFFGDFWGGNLDQPYLPLIGQQDAFITLVNPRGETVWTRRFGGNQAFTQAQSITTDREGNLYLAGIFQNANLTSPAIEKIGAIDTFVLKLNAQGDNIWARNYGGPQASMYVKSMAVDDKNRIYLAGDFDKRLSIPALSPIGKKDAFLVRLDATGTIGWAKNFGASDIWATSTSAVLDRNGNVFLAGPLTDNFTVPPLARIGFEDTYVLKFDSDGNRIWEKTIGGRGAGVATRSVSTDGSGNAYLTGYLQSGNLDEVGLTRMGGLDALAIKIDPSGSIVWAKNLGGANTDAVVFSATSDVTGSITLGGFYGTNDMTTPPLPASGHSSAFVIKVTPVSAPGAPNILSVSPRNGGALVDFSPPYSDGGSPVLGYTALCGAQSASAPTPPILVSKLTNGEAVNCTVIAKNAIGQSLPSLPVPVSPYSTIPQAGGIDPTGSGKGSILIRSVSGNPYRNLQIGSLNPTTNRLAFVSIPDPGANSLILGAGDFGNRHRSDLLLQSADSGMVTYWKGFDAFLDSQVSLRPVKPGWIVRAIADLDGDGKSDIVWRYVGSPLNPPANPDDIGVAFVWFMNDAQISEIRPRGGAPLSWSLIGTADLYGSHRSILIWVSPSGEIRGLVGGADRTFKNLSLGNVPSGYALIRMGDYDGDGYDDLLFQGPQGQLKVWSMRGTNVLSQSDLPSPDPSLTLFAAADLNGDGTIDLIFLKPDKSVVIWLMTPNVPGKPTVIPNAGTIPDGFVSVNEY